MGTTREEFRFSEQRNYTRVLIPVYCVLSAIVGYALAGPMAETSTVNRTLKLCNEKPLECKFKYDMVRYQETGQIPYKEVKAVKDSK
jgi:hypothetical protein